MTSFDQPWRPQLDWSAPAGRVLDQLVDALPANRKWEIIVFPAHNTQILWRELFGKDIDVRVSIIAPALAERPRAYGGDADGLKARRSGIKPSK